MQHPLELIENNYQRKRCRDKTSTMQQSCSWHGTSGHRVYIRPSSQQEANEVEVTAVIVIRVEHCGCNMQHNMW